MDLIPSQYKFDIIKKTHGQMIRTVMFFDKHRGNSQFIERIVYSLKAINISQDEVLYHTNDKAEFIYFIFQGKFMLVIDVNDYMSTTS
jgi:CRP-like cAMP-binding protein